jgi:hypothetical protein
VFSFFLPCILYEALSKIAHASGGEIIDFLLEKYYNKIKKRAEYYQIIDITSIIFGSQFSPMKSLMDTTQHISSFLL